MVMKLIKKEEVTIDGVVYIVETYSNGERESVVKYTKPSDIPEEPEEPQPTQLDRIEEAVNEIKNSENSEALNALLGG